MNRFFELKLVDIVRVNPSKRKKNPNESDMHCKEVLVKKLQENENGTKNAGNVVVYSKVDDTLRDLDKSVEQRITRSSNNKHKTNMGHKKSPKEQLIENRVFEHISSLKYLKNNENKQPAVKISRDISKNNAGYFVKNRISDSLNNIDNVNKKTNQDKVNRRQKRNTRKSFWESKLTGARRVSKRLTNLKNKIKIASKLETSSDTNGKLYEKRNPIELKVECKTKAVHHVKLGRKEVTNLEKSAGYSRNRKKQKSNYGKLNQTNKLFPRVAPTRRTSTSHREKMKSNILPLLSDIEKPLNVSSSKNISKNQEACSGKEENTNSNVCLTTVKDISKPIQKENHEPSTDLSNSKDLNGMDEINEHQMPNAVVENTIEPTTTKNDCVSEIKDESLSSSEVLIIDLESGENVLQLECEILAQNLNFALVNEEEPEQVSDLTHCNEIISGHNSIQNSELVDNSGTCSQSETETVIMDSVTDNTIVQIEGRLVKEDEDSSEDQKNNMEAAIKLKL